MEGNVRVDRSEMAGHLLAELYNARDLYKTGQMSASAFLALVQRGRRRARSGERGQLYQRADTRMPQDYHPGGAAGNFSGA